MKPIPKSGYYNTNNFGRIALLSYEEVLGKGGLNALLNMASLSNLVDNYPPANMERGFDFADYTAILVALEDLYGPRGGRGLAQRAGRATFNDILNNYGAMAGVTDLAFKVLPLQLKIRIGLTSAAKTFSEASDQLTSVQEVEDTIVWTVHRCPSCWTRQGSDKPVCYVTVGFLQASLQWLSSGREFRVNESKCCAMGDTACEFVVQKEPIS
jgi:predicted hydrocarbon binding protein